MWAEGNAVFHARAAAMTGVVHCDSGYRSAREPCNGGVGNAVVGLSFFRRAERGGRI